MTHECDFALADCAQEADFVAYLGAGGDSYACGPCMNQSDEAELFVPIYEVEASV